MKNTVYLHKVSSVVPENSYTQEFAVDFLLKLIGDSEKKRNFLKRVYDDTAIHKRHTVINDYGKLPEEYTFYPKNEKMTPEPGTTERNDLFIKEAERLSIATVKGLFVKVGPTVKDKITHIITVSCTGFSAPGYDFYLVKELGLNPSIDRFNIGFMGCYAAFPAMKLAKSICSSDENAKVLIVNVELCTLHFQQKFEPDTVVANAIFADGVSAVLISANVNDSDGAKIILHDFHSYIIPGSENDMAWKIGPNGFDMRLSYYVPKLIDANIHAILENIFKKAGAALDEIKIWAVHPGGKAILEKLAATLKLTKEDFAESYEILWNYGNMSSATIMFVLEKILQSKKSGKIFSCAFGPGLTVESAVMEKVL